ncbi:1-acyl-sn-glycerol-3-phosphate acyltransferase [Cupriavidus sp. AU9028]|uniref:lysophospholipid acyltransferase family protein n=1 Tax=Cupriavidus sp. AU9028 TaxID=2871157 RepID=UPI001C93C523|nr:lysophospholipid acyltransferase family protein [Cupriavidus sp. AU9028]MBY4898106.1 1-acyl-sn-glycerol-3-phosphate acyltransferase [Cupriavidus sp. AU9028]
MLRWRKLLLVLHLLRGVLTCALLFPWLGVPARNTHIRRWSRRLLRLCGVEVQCIGEPPAQGQGVMLVANHISWLDIFVIHSCQPARFVAKSEIRRWPVVGWLCEKTGTLFIERGRKRDAHRVLHDLVACMRHGDQVCVFPEGTTSDGLTVLPFHANLMQAPVAGDLPVLPLGLRYRDAASGAVTVAPAYIGEMSLLDSLDVILKAPPIRAELAFGPRIDTRGFGRRSLAELARDTVVCLCEGRGDEARQLVNDAQARQRSEPVAEAAAAAPATPSSPSSVAPA